MAAPESVRDAIFSAHEDDLAGEYRKCLESSYMWVTALLGEADEEDKKFIEAYNAVRKDAVTMYHIAHDYMALREVLSIVASDDIIKGYYGNIVGHFMTEAEMYAY